MKTLATLVIPIVTLLFAILAISHTPPGNMKRSRSAVFQSEPIQSERHEDASLFHQNPELLSDEDLIGQLHQLTTLRGQADGNEDRDQARFDHCLSEMVRRGGECFELAIATVVKQRDRLFKDALQARGHNLENRRLFFEEDTASEDQASGQALEALTEQSVESPAPKLTGSDDSWAFHEYSNNLELVTALRRLQGRPDPLQIFVNSITPYYLSWPDMPVLRVSIRNVDT